jgi:hypothetical protein
MLPPAEAHPSPQRDRQSKGAQKFVHGSFSSNDQSPRRHWWQSLHFQLILDPPARRDHKKLGIAVATRTAQKDMGSPAAYERRAARAARSSKRIRTNNRR